MDHIKAIVTRYEEILDERDATIKGLQINLRDCERSLESWIDKFHELSAAKREVEANFASVAQRNADLNQQEYLRARVERLEAENRELRNRLVEPNVAALTAKLRQVGVAEVQRRMSDRNDWPYDNRQFDVFKDKIPAIKFIRDEFGYGLLESKLAYERWTSDERLIDGLAATPGDVYTRGEEG